MGDAPTGEPTLQALADAVEMTDVEASQLAHAELVPALGRLREIAEWLAGTHGGWPLASAPKVRLVSRTPISVTTAAVADAMDVGVDHVETTAIDVAAAFVSGTAAADALVEAGIAVLVVADADASVAAAALVSSITDHEPVAFLPRGADAIDTEAWIERAGRLRDLRRRVRPVHDDPDALLRALGDPGLATTCGLLAAAIARRTAVVLDGTRAMAAAVLCARARQRAGRWLQIADTSPDPVHRRAVDYLDRRPLLDLDTHGGDALAGLLAISLLRTAAELGRPEGTEGQ
jgi:NaMN:DMB phosphoribosyltransferase